jgi:hypothetical protein
MTSGSSTTLSSAPIEVVAVAIQGGEGRAPAVRPIETAGSPIAGPLVAREAMASAVVVVSGAGTPSPPVVAVGEPWGPASSGASWASSASGTPPTLGPVAPVAGVMVNKKFSQIQYE